VRRLPFWRGPAISGPRSWRAGILLLLLLPGVVYGQASTITVRPHFRDFQFHRMTILPHQVLQRPKIGLVLSGGGARGIAQIGVLKVFERYGIPVDFIAATSMGAVVGGLYASGYSAAELESLAVHANWDEILALSNAAERRTLFIDQKAAADRSFVAVRFEGFEPVLPAALSNGQRLTDFINEALLHSLYHPYPDFDYLRIPFRALATDLISGKGIVLDGGSMAQALRASSSVPLMFNPVEKEGMSLVDGGLVQNIPTNLSREAGCDITVVVNSTSGLRGAAEMKAPWQTADQIMGIMMQSSNQQQLQLANLVITPDIGKHLSSDFTGIDSLIASGVSAAEAAVPTLLDLIHRKKRETVDTSEILRSFADCIVERSPGEIPDSLWERIGRPSRFDLLTVHDVRSIVEALYETGRYRDVVATIHPSFHPVHVVISAHPNPHLQAVELAGCNTIPQRELQLLFQPMMGKVIDIREGEEALEKLVRYYRQRQYSLAHIDTTSFDADRGILRLVIDEGVISGIDIQGGIRTQDSFVLREFPLRVGNIFTIEKAQEGIRNINGTTLFESVYLDATFVDGRPFLIVRLKERPSQLVRFGLRADDERHLQGLVDIRDENFHGTGTDLGFMLSGGQRNSDATLEYRARRLFGTNLTFGVNLFHRVRDSYLFFDGPPPGDNRWERVTAGEYRDLRYGFGLSFGSQLERLGNASMEFILQNVRILSLENTEGMEERHRLAMFRLGTVFDTKDRYPFPTSGVSATLSYEFALQNLGSDVGYNALTMMYESYSTLAGVLTFHPRIMLGFADKTMPLSQQFRLGGRESFYGLREDDRRGRQVVVANMELQYHLPLQLLFDTYVRARYDLGALSVVPEDIKFSSLLHGIGLELAFDSPLGPAVLGVGESFYFPEATPQKPIQRGPLLLYFGIGYQL
jgi:NTE family protein